MARKPLLTEAEIRSFMKLADLAPIGDVKLQEMGYGPEVTVAEEEEDEIEDVELDTAVDEPAPMEPAGDMGDLDEPAMEPEMDDMGMDDMGDEAGGDKEDQLMDIFQKLADLLDVEIDMDSDGDMEAEDEMETMMGDEADSLEGGDDSGDEAEPMVGDDLPPVDDEEDDELVGNMGAVYESKEEIVNEVAKRVAARLQAQSDKQQLAEELTEKIFNRLVKNG